MHEPNGWSMRGAPLLLAVVALASGLLLCEGALSIWHPQIHRRPPNIWQFDAELGWSHVPGGQGRLVTPEFDVGIEINRDGLRSPAYERPKREGVRRVLVFGDSFAEGWGVEGDEMLSARLQDCLSDSGEAAEVLNFGVAGYGTDQAYLLFQKLGQSYQPDLVVLLFYGNDLWNNASPRGIGAEQGYKPYFRPARDGRLELLGVPVRKTRYWDATRYEGGSLGQRVAHYLRSHWHVYALAEKALRTEMPVAKQSQFYDGLYGIDAEGQWQHVWELTGMLLRDFDRAVRRSEAEFLVTYAPSIVQIEEQNWQEKRVLHGLGSDYDLQKPNRYLADLTRRYGIDYLDLYPHFAAAAQRSELYLRDSHWNAGGHALAAEVLCENARVNGVDTP